MSTVSLYRKYRSQRFSDLCGQEHVTVTLQNALRGDRVAHAYLFCGPRGTGKTSAARLLAKALNCEAPPLRAGNRPAAEPCDECPSCEQIRSGSSLDVIEIDAASHRGIDDVRALREGVAYQPVQGRFKVYVIDEAHMLTGEAFNALLKTLEEPPSHVVFILATTEVHKVPATILSRCQRFDFRRGTPSQIEGRLREVVAAEGLEAEPEAIALLARHAGGSWRDALSILEQTIAYSGDSVTAEAVRTVLGLVSDDVLFDLSAAVQSGSAAEIFRLVDQAVSAGKDPRQLLYDLTEHFRELLLAAAGAAVPGDERAARVREQAASFGLPRLLAAVEMLATGEKELRWSQQSRLLVEVLLARLAQPSAAALRAAPATPAPAGGAARPAPVERAPAPSRAAPPRAAPPVARSPDPAARSTIPPAPWEIDTPLSVGDSRAGVEAGDAADLEALFPSAGAGPGATTPPASGSRADSPATEGSAAGAGDAALPAGSGDGPLAEITRSWRLIREELKRRKKPFIAGSLADAKPRALQGETLVIELPTRQRVELLEQQLARHPDAIVEVIADICRIRCRLAVATPEEPAPVDPSSRPASGEAGGTARRAAPAAAPRAAPEARAAGAAPGPGAVAPHDPAPNGGSSELIHQVVDLFEGRIVDE